MADLHYHVVEHMGGWAYRLGDSFSETFDTRDEAFQAAKAAAAHQHAPGDDTAILYQDADGRWKREWARGDDRPDPDVVLD